MITFSFSLIWVNFISGKTKIGAKAIVRKMSFDEKIGHIFKIICELKNNGKSLLLQIKIYMDSVEPQTNCYWKENRIEISSQI